MGYRVPNSRLASLRWLRFNRGWNCKVARQFSFSVKRLFRAESELSIAFAKLIWWQALLAIVIWPYFLGLAAR
jgi:hypothetical protein